MNFRKTQMVVWGTLCLALFISFFHRFSIGVVADELTRSLMLSAAALSNIGAVYFYVYAAVQVPVGILIDTWGPRKLCASGVLLAGLGSFLFSISQTYFMAFSGRFLVGLGFAGIFLSILKIQATWFPVRYFSGLAGITSAIGNAGGVMASAPFALLVLWMGWRWAYTLLAIVSIVCALAIYVIVRDKPEERGFPAVSNELTRSSLTLKEGLVNVLRNKKTWPVFFSFSGVMGSTMTLAGVWGVPYLMQVHGLAKDQASQVTMFMMIGFLVGSPLFGILASKLGRVKSIIRAGYSTSLVLWAAIIFVPQVPSWSLPILFFLLGISSITFFLNFTNAKEVNDPHFSGIATSVVNQGGFFVGAITSLLVGAILDLTWDGTMHAGLPVYSDFNFRLALSSLFAFAVIGWIGSMFLREERELAHDKS